MALVISRRRTDGTVDPQGGWKRQAERPDAAKPPFQKRRTWMVAAVVALVACAPSALRPDSRAVVTEPGVLLEYSKLIQDYIAALLLLNSSHPADWKEARVKLESLGFGYFEDDKLLIEKFRTGTPEESEIARRELGRRGRMLDLVLVFSRPYAPATWENARRELLALSIDGDAPAFLTISLLKILMNGQFQAVWTPIRYQLVELGDVALETTAEMARQKADATPETPIWKQEDLVQLVMILISFGQKGRPALEALAKHRVWNVRKAVAKAIGDSTDLGDAEILVDYLKNDREWQVKATAADSLGRLRAGRATLGPILVERMKAERDGFVQHAVLRAIGRIQYLGAIPHLINVIDVPNYETAGVAMEALFALTGERLTTSVQWQRWYRETYPRWIKDQTP